MSPRSIMSWSSVAASDTGSDTTDTSIAESEKPQRSYERDAIYLDKVSLYARPEPVSIPLSPPLQETGILSRRTSSLSMDDETIKAAQLQETMTAETTADISTPGLGITADMSTAETAADTSTTEASAGVSFILELGVSEWRSDGVGNGGKIHRRKVIREFDIDELDDFEALFKSVVDRSNFDGKIFPERYAVTEKFRKAIDSAAGYYREKTTDFLLDKQGDHPYLFKEDLLPPDVLSQALLWLRYARALRQIAECLRNKEEVDLGVRGLFVGLSKDEKLALKASKRSKA